MRTRCLPSLHGLAALMLFGAILFCCGCSLSRPTARTYSYADFQFPDKTLVLGEIDGNLLTRKEIMSGLDLGARVHLPPLYQELLALGYRDEEIVDGCVAAVLHSAHWHNASTGLDAKFGYRWATVDKSVLAGPLDVAEIEIVNGTGKVIRIRHKEGLKKEGSVCSMKKYEKDPVAATLDVLNPVGGPGSVSLECPGLEEEGWEKRRYSMYGEHIWVKLPKP